MSSTRSTRRTTPPGARAHPVRDRAWTWSGHLPWRGHRTWRHAARDQRWHGAWQHLHRRSSRRLRPRTTRIRHSAPAQPPRDRQTPRLRILLVEDHQDSADMLSQLLTLHDYEVTVASIRRRSALAAASREFDLLISDIRLPDGSGLELMRRLRANQDIRGIAISGFRDRRGSATQSRSRIRDAPHQAGGLQPIARGDRTGIGPSAAGPPDRLERCRIPTDKSPILI